MTSEWVHYGMAENVFGRRSTVLAEAYEKHPKRFIIHNAESNKQERKLR
jgi:hypothetical protein